MKKEVKQNNQIFCTLLVSAHQLTIDFAEIECLVMEDLIYYHTYPCVMDIKMGRVTYDPNASVAKRESESIKYPEQKTFGFRLLGYRVHFVCLLRYNQMI